MKINMTWVYYFIIMKDTNSFELVTDNVEEKDRMLFGRCANFYFSNNSD